MGTNDPQDAFIERLNRHRGILFKVAHAYCRDPASRDDLVQDMIVQLWRAYARFDERLRFSTWMYRIVVNVAISFYRRQARTRQSLVRAEARVLENLPAARETEVDDRLIALRESIDQLDELNRALMILYLDDNSYAEIAAILGISETNVATKVARIKERLRRDLNVAARNG